MQPNIRYNPLLLAAFIACGCVGGSGELSDKEKRDLARYVIDKPPQKLSRKLNINYDHKVTLLGCDIEPAGQVKPGQRVQVTMYWRADKDLEPGWNLFTHVLDASGERVLNIDNVGPLREWRADKQALGPSDWQPGKIYVDKQEFTIPASVKTNRIQVVTGVWKGDDRLKIVGGRASNGGNRGVVANIPTGLSSGIGTRLRSTRTPLLRVNKLEKNAKIKIDGKLDEDVWQRAPLVGPFVNVATGEPERKFPVSGHAKLLWSDEGFYVGFEVRDPDIVGGFKAGEKDPHLWTKDTVELMIDPEGDGDNKDYYEIQINPQNLVFDSHFDDYNKPKTEPNGPFGHQEWTANVKSAVHVEGTLDKPGDRDARYVVEALVPWKSFAKSTKAPPELGSIWRMNFYAMQENNGVSWSPILGQGNFHKASRFGRILWADSNWMPAEARERVQHLRPGAQPGAPLAPGQMPRIRVPHAAGSGMRPATQPLPDKPTPR
jgi:hypothetical protein